jgi:hypothetical protein
MNLSTAESCKTERFKTKKGTNNFSQLCLTISGSGKTGAVQISAQDGNEELSRKINE